MLSKKLLLELVKYIDVHLIPVRLEVNESIKCHHNQGQQQELLPECLQQEELTNFINKNKKLPFSTLLFKYIDQTGVNDSDVYKKAGIDRRHFSKIRSNPAYRPSKNTVLSLAIALELNQEETDELLGAAGYTLSDSETFDLVIRFFIERKIYNIYDVNQALEYFSQKTIAGIIE